MTEKQLLPTLPQSWKPHPYQKVAVRWLVKNAAAGLFLDPGLGKTSCTLKAFDVLKKAGVASRALVIAPMRVCHEVWPAEAQEWREFTHLRVVVLHGPGKEYLATQDADLYVINPEGLDWLLANNGRILKDLDVDTLVVDESSKFKHTSTKRFKLLKPYLRLFSRRWILTGTPNPNGYMDLFGQIYVLDLGKALGQYITHYRANYFSLTGFGGYTWVLKDGSEEAIQAAVKPYILRLDAEDYLKLPQLQTNIIRVELPSKARKIYDQLEEEMIAELDGGNVVEAVSAGAVSQKCCQVANGGLYYMDLLGCGVEMAVRGQRKTVQLHSAKTDALIDLVDELQGQPLLVAYEYEHDLQRIQAAFGGKLPYIGGGVSTKDTHNIVEQWNAGRLPVLPVQPASAGHGLNMQKSHCAHVCWYSTTWDLELYDQLIRRVRRQGNRADRVMVHHIVARNTVDDAKLAALRRKDKSQKALLAALRTYVKTRKSA
jgi:SNF2 family DNA or RNA helicase